LEPIEWPTEDELLDSVSPHLRNKVLAEARGEGVYTSVWSEMNERQRVWWWVKFGIHFTWAMFLCLVGIIMCLTLILSPIGFVVIMLSGRKLAKMIMEVSAHSKLTEEQRIALRISKKNQ
jgi:hypothetical protein